MMINKIRQALRDKQKVNKKVDTIVLSVNSFKYLLQEIQEHRMTVGYFAEDPLGARITAALVEPKFERLQKLAAEMQFEGRKIQLINEETTVVVA